MIYKKERTAAFEVDYESLSVAVTALAIDEGVLPEDEFLEVTDLDPGTDSVIVHADVQRILRN